MSVVIPRSSSVKPRFFFWIAIAIALAVLWGFAPTYYLRSFLTTRDLGPLLHLHGFVFSGWIALVVVQTTLVANGRTDLHRRLGIAGVVLAAMVVTLGLAVGYFGAGPQLRSAVQSAGSSLEAFAILAARNPGNALIFGILAAAGIALRRQPAAHKRLMLLSTLAILDAPMARLLNDFGWPIALTPRGFVGENNFYERVSPTISPAGFENLNTLPFFLALVVNDAVRIRRLHAATIGGGVLLFLLQPFFLFVSRQLAGT